MRIGTEMLFQFTLNGGGALVNNVERQVSVHPHVCLNGDAIANAARSQIVRLLHIMERLDDLNDFAFRFFRQRTLRQFAYALFKQ